MWEGGACNPRPMARLLNDLVQQACDQKGSKGPAESIEFRLVLHQLLFVLFGTDPYSSYPVFRDADCLKDVDLLREKMTWTNHHLAAAQLGQYDQVAKAVHEDNVQVEGST